MPVHKQLDSPSHSRQRNDGGHRNFRAGEVEAAISEMYNRINVIESRMGGNSLDNTVSFKGEESRGSKGSLGSTGSRTDGRQPIEKKERSRSHDK